MGETIPAPIEIGAGLFLPGQFGTLGYMKWFDSLDKLPPSLRFRWAGMASKLTARKLVIIISVTVLLAVIYSVYFFIDKDTPISDSDGSISSTSLGQAGLSQESDQPILASSSSPILSESSPSLPFYAGQPIENLGNDPIIKQFPAENVERQKKFLREATLLLRQRPDDFDAWIAVGVHKKFFNNFQGARDAWEYAKLLKPEVVLPYLNLGNLYAYHIRDLVKAESNFSAASQRDPNNIFGSYSSLADFYRDFGFKDRAITVYQKILALTPNDNAVKTEIERLQKAN